MAPDPVDAVLNPPELARFREVAEVSGPLSVAFDGWSKLALLTADRVFLFPRRGREVPLLHGARVCEALHERGVAVVPRVLGRWEDPELSFAPFVAFERRPGRPWTAMEDAASSDDVEEMLQSLGAAIATWHEVDHSGLPDTLKVPASYDAKPWLGRFLAPAGLEEALRHVKLLSGASERSAGAWCAALAPVTELPPVYLHGDVCENQLLVDQNGRVETVLDWDTAGIGHPIHDFDFGEWGFGISRWVTDFARLRRVMWDAYAAHRESDAVVTADQIHLTFVLSETVYFAERERDGLLDAWGKKRLAQLRTAIGPATEAVS